MDVLGGGGFVLDFSIFTKYINFKHTRLSKILVFPHTMDQRFPNTASHSNSVYFNMITLQGILCTENIFVVGGRGSQNVME